MKNRGKFRMKRFQLSDARCGCKIGVDGTLIGSWAPISPDAVRALDAGCGCALIAMMIAQRNPSLNVTAIDVNEDALLDASQNVAESIFADRIEVRNCALDSLLAELDEGRFDLIVSNPPFFESGIDPAGSARMLARHAGTLSPESLIRAARTLLTPRGALAFIAPASYIRKYLGIARECELHPEKICFVKGHPGADCKRVMLYLTRSDSCGVIGEGSTLAKTCPEEINAGEIQKKINQKTKRCRIGHLIIRDKTGNYTHEYKTLGKDFYLKF
ncbi:MAG: tRNA (adenine(22)-N(1))-methyltransferase TrmK [Muribaculaceae bacterium]|nr:tRNA (adenine(22)-N(1))-methyltransferase TrmK [Muribaculaceae bacterium]